MPATQSESSAEDGSRQALLRELARSPSAYRLMVFGVLHGGDARMVGAVVRLLASALLNAALDMDVLDACGAFRGHRLWFRFRVEYDESGDGAPRRCV